MGPETTPLPVAALTIGVGLFAWLRREAGDLRQRLARLQGMVDGLREATVGASRWNSV